MTAPHPVPSAPARSHRHLASAGPLWHFYVLAFVLSWAVWVPPLLVDSLVGLPLNIGTFGPAAAAVVLVAHRQGRSSARRLVARMTRWRVSPVWYGVALLGPPVVMGAAVLAHVALGGAVTWYADPAHPSIPAGGIGRALVIPLVFALVLLLSVVGEELGWRAHALPQLLDRGQSLAASLLLGSVWALWHLPLFFTPDALQQRLPALWFVLQILGQSILITWVFNRTGRSALLAALLHAASNTSVGLLPVLPLDASGSPRVLWFALALEWLAVAIVLTRFGTKLGRDDMASNADPSVSSTPVR